MRTLCLCIIKTSHLVFFHVYYKHLITWFSRANWYKKAFVNVFKDHKSNQSNSQTNKIYSCLFTPNCTRNHLITYTNYAVLSFFACKTCFCLFANKLGCYGFDLTKRNVFLFLLLNYAAFSFVTLKRCFRLFVAKVTLFSALSHWRLSCKLPYSQITSLLDLSYRNRFSAYLPLNWAVFALSQPKEVSCLFSANHLNISQRTVTQAVFSSIEPKSTCFLLVCSWFTLFLA